MKKGYRIISIEAADIYRHEQENGVAVGYKMPEKKSDAYFRLFKIYLDNSLDLIELEKAYARICRKKFSFQDKKENEYEFYDTAMDYIYQAVKKFNFQKGKKKKVDYMPISWAIGYKTTSDWRIYAPIVISPAFKKFSRERALPIGCVAEKEGGEFIVYGKKFARKR